MPHTAIALIRPRHAEDPALFFSGQGFLFADMLHQLKARHIFARIILSLPRDTPEEYVAIVAQWNLPFVLSDQGAAPARLAEIFMGHGLKHAVILTAYSYLLDIEELQKAQSLLETDAADCIVPMDVSQAGYFCGLSKLAIKRLNDVIPEVNPFSFFQELARNPGNLKLQSIPSVEPSAEQYLMQLCGDGPAALFPSSFVRQSYSMHRQNWFSRKLYKQLLVDHLQTKNIAWLTQFLRKKPELSYAILTNHASQIAWAERLRQHLPRDPGGRFLEIGFGYFPVSASLLLDFFTHGLAVDICQPDENVLHGGLELILELHRHLPHLLPSDCSGLSTMADIFARISLEQKPLAALQLPDDSFDFIFSKGVLYLLHDPAPLLEEMARLLKSGGSMLHQTAFFYWAAQHPVPDFSHLSCSKEDWADSGKPGNNWRINDIVSFLEAKGLTVEIVRRENMPHFIAPKKLHPSWEGYSEQDLYCASAIIKAVRPKK